MSARLLADLVFVALHAAEIGMIVWLARLLLADVNAERGE